MKLKVIKSVVLASPRKLNANYTIENVEDSWGTVSNRGTEYTEIALDFIKYDYDLKLYIEAFGGPECRNRADTKYRPLYAINLKHKAWFIELFGEN